MPDCDSLLAEARGNPSGLKFEKLCLLAECFGWVLDRTRGSHRIFKRTGTMQAMNFQDFRGKAKAYQVRQLLAAIDSLESQ